MKPAPNQIDVSVIIVSYNVSELLDTCLATLKKFTQSVSYEVIVVDSASSDDSVAMVQKKHPWVKLIAKSENVGFVKGNNLGLQEATGKHILYLNPDIELIEDAIGPLYRYLETHDSVGIVGCKLLNTDRSHQSSIGNFTRLTNLWREYALREKMGQHPVHHPETPTPVEVLLGACLLVRGSFVREIGGFDERYFMYHEETDLCRTAQEHGLQIIYFPDVAMIHHGSKSSTSSPERRQRSLHENRKSQYIYFKKHASVVTAQVAKLMILGALLPRMLIFRLKPTSENRLKAQYYSQTVRWLLTH